MTYKTDFLQFAIESEVLCFGEFTLKSGRISPYFFNAGLFNTGSAIAKLGKFYATAIAESGVKFDVLFGPAYKGIPLAAVTAAFLAENYNINVGFSYDRKEAKDHGEGGVIVGAKLQKRILVIDDVISAGTSIRHSINLIHQHKAEFAGVIVCLDRQEKGQGQTSAIGEIETEFQIPVLSIVNLKDLINFVGQDENLQTQQANIENYRQQYGISPDQ